MRCVIDPLTDRHEGARTGQNRARCRAQQRDHRIPPSSQTSQTSQTSRIGYPDQKAPQVSGVPRRGVGVREGQLTQSGGHG